MNLNNLDREKNYLNETNVDIVVVEYFYVSELQLKMMHTQDDLGDMFG